MEEGATAVLADVVGREPELARLREFARGAAETQALVLCGEAGIGKTTLWEAGLEYAREHALRTLVARPSGAEAGLSFAALIDLFEGIGSDTLAALPDPQRSALDVALLRARPTRTPPEPHAIALGFLAGLRALAAEGPVAVAVDDIQWLDQPSAEVLAFVARRLRREHVVFLVARRPGTPSEFERALGSLGLSRLDVGPLSFSASRRLLLARLGLVLPRQTLRRIVQTTLGNPLFVLEVGRALLERGTPGIAEDIPVPDAIDELLGARVERLEHPLRRALLAVALSGELRVDELMAAVGSDAVEDAIHGGLLLSEGVRVRPAHPLFAAAAKQRSRPRERRELHRALALAVGDQELRALHLAHASERPDPELARTVAIAAGEASVRGARLEAATLAEHALRLTPVDAADRPERLLELAGYLEEASQFTRLGELLSPEADSIPAGPLRARAWLMLAETVADPTDYVRHIDLAIAEAEADPGLYARAVAAKVTNAAAVEVSRLAAAEELGQNVLPTALRHGGEVGRRVLYALGWALAMRGRPIDELCERFLASSEGAYYIVHSPIRVAAQRLVWRGETEQARAELNRLLALADERGEPSSYALARLHLCELELRVGGWDGASRLLDEWQESWEGELLDFPMHERCRALLAAGRGQADEAREWAASAQERADATGSRWDWLEAMRARGMCALLEQNPGLAAESLRMAWQHTCREGVNDPGVFPVAPDLVEALADHGALDEARGIVDRLERLSVEQEHPWGLAASRRCAGIVQLAAGPYDERAAVAVSEAAGDYERMGLHFDRARTLLSLGRAQRRSKKWGPARESLERAVAAFEELGSLGWAERARVELGRIGARRPRGAGELTATEREVVELAAAGRSNKEIAHALSLAVHTVEVHLSRAYAKLGVRSRSQLAGRLSSAR